MDIKYVFFTKDDEAGTTTSVLEISPSPFVWKGDPRVMHKVLDAMANAGLYLLNPADNEHLPDLFKGEDLFCLKNPIE